MKVLRRILVLVVVLTFNYGYTQQKEYKERYSDAVPKLQSLVERKESFYDKKFNDFYKILNKKRIKVEGVIVSPKNYERDAELYIIELDILDDEIISYAYKNSLAIPKIEIWVKEQIPLDILKTQREKHGIWDKWYENYFSNYTIEKIKFYGIKGMNNEFHSPL